MYADFFAHPDLFVSITDCPTPQDRMVQVLKWYLSAFHAGRKSSIAKKPYNPVLGEVFKCYWNVPGVESNENKAVEGPIPWASTTNLTFVAEQVSHHPPISAFYAENVEKRIMCSGHIWTKSKFLGLISTSLQMMLRFVLDDNAGLLSYYTSKEKMIKGDRRGCVRLKGAVIGIDDEDDSTFTITVDGKMFHFQAHDAEERSRWVTALEDTILRHTHRRRTKKSDQSQVPTLSDFERKLTETDTYLQLLITQTKQLDEHIENTSIDSEKEKYLAIKTKTLSLLDGIKHTIVLLQIAKSYMDCQQNTTHPVNGVFTNSIATSVDSTTNSSLSEELVNNENQLESSGSDRVVSHTSRPPLEHSYSVSESVLNLHSVPEVSYSSSDDDDFFYDAPEETSPSSVMTKPIVESAAQVIDNSDDMNSQTVCSKQNNSIDYDLMYESEEEELGSIEGHGSVISHLISQVKIGMDLTKVVLPTFILERRSLLEMYADFFAHPDLFVSITDCPTPQDRMVQVLKWYLSAFHAGRKSSIAKKPYNPVLGEVFKCYWNVPGVESNENKAVEGPIPWASTTNLTFIAEQVSHHPPISAFYAENVEKRIMCSGI
ncbi:unnamed protein product [Oppiella nova]|uniref:Oxysterol-binding protein n=1 Tax=Oppiella nova TaxID=334625 RepID=A0A7R9MDM8_9ACAR|nr:unnamed protein product [Oppiella nova]CAG2174428.1 unnamed protein product [Oppiella nova]